MASGAIHRAAVAWKMREAKAKAEAVLSPQTPLPDGRCVWNTLPQEIKDFIFELAYVPTNGCTPMHKSSWQPRVCRCYGSCPVRGLEAQTSWDPKVPMETLMVDREWYHAASKVFYSRTTFVLGHNVEYDHPDEFQSQHYHGQQIEQFVCDNTGKPWPYAKLITRITFVLDFPGIAEAMVKAARTCPSLKHVHLQLAADYFDDLLDDLYGDLDLVRSLYTKDEMERFDPELFELRGLSTLTVEEIPRHGEVDEVSLANLETLGEALRITASQPRPADWIVAGDPEQIPGLDKRSPNASTDAHLCPWNRLPRELKYDILEMAYVPRRRVYPLHKARWDVEEDERRRWQGKHYEARWFPAKMVERFMVSREWYDIASSAFYKHTKFGFNSAYTLLDFVAKDGKPYKYTQRIGKATVYLDLLSGESALTDAVAFCSSLRSLKLDVWGSFFQEATDVDVTNPPLSCIYTTAWSVEDFNRFEATKCLLSLRGVADVRITAIAEKADRLYLRNLALLELLLQRAASRPRVDHTQEGGLQTTDIPPGQSLAIADQPLPVRPSRVQNPERVPIRDGSIPDESELFHVICEDRTAALHAWALRRRGE
ncbi:hypothetical protein PRZ48_008478 [Zasmidium cellare]|uniref:DNA-directed DNA polymerase n=1 Tax=Zasmidium cellare TaxID=395010 RepID=A0ABR0EFL4_ZASCE|nr:hypothetical protein PRZ48_008478 [Zasmidium cellare]